MLKMLKKVMLPLFVVIALVAAMVVPAMAQEEGPGEVTVNITPLEGQQASGMATLTGMDGQTEVVVEMSGLEPGQHINHIHEGTADSPGEVLFPLTVLDADEDGNATATTTLDMPLSDLTVADRVIAVHALDGQIISTGQIPEAVAQEKTPTATPTEEETPTATPTPEEETPTATPTPEEETPTATPTPEEEVAGREAAPGAAGGIAPTLVASTLAIFGSLMVGGSYMLRRNTRR